VSWGMKQSTAEIRTQLPMLAMKFPLRTQHEPLQSCRFDSVGLALGIGCGCARATTCSCGSCRFCVNGAVHLES
jgi:hypothetical protein